MTTYQQRQYVVRYPDGETETVTAHMVRLEGDGGVTLKKAPGDNPGNIVFAATPTSGVTVTQIGGDS